MLSTVSFGSNTRSQSARSLAVLAPSSPTSAALLNLDDELRDARRVLSQGQEEDLRYALDRVLNKVEELSSLLKTAIKTQTELETQLNLAKSNLQLVISNNEMLEEALKRDTPCSAKDVGWRRWSAREAQNHNTERKSDERPRSLDYGPLNESGAPSAPSTSAVVLVNGVKPSAPTTSTPQPTASMTSQESKFFRFRFGSGTRSPVPPPHLTSPSLPSLVPNAQEKEIEELQEKLEREREARKAADAAKAALEAELESLSQALFEEANKMVATERMRRAETEEELSQVHLEKDVLLQALKLIEGENGRLRSAISLPDTTPVVVDSPVCVGPRPPSPRPPSRPPADDATPPVTPSDGISGHLTGFVLEPAPKPSLAVLHRETASMEHIGPTELSISSLTEPLALVTASRPPPLLPSEPSPWADVKS